MNITTNQRFRDRLWQRQPSTAGRYHPWLIDRGSLTRRILARSQGMTVKVVFQGLSHLHRDERFLAGSACTRGLRALTRDVVLYVNKTPVVYAHSVLRPGDQGSGWRLMQGIASRPLGAALFADPRIRRLPLHQRKLGRGHELYKDANSIAHKSGGGSTIWARRSLFIVGKSPILVTEVFLPGVLAL